MIVYGKPGDLGNLATVRGRTAVNPGNPKGSRRRKLKPPQCFLGFPFNDHPHIATGVQFPKFPRFPTAGTQSSAVMRANGIPHGPIPRKRIYLSQPTTGALWGSSRPPRHRTPSGLREQNYALNSTQRSSRLSANADGNCYICACCVQEPRIADSVSSRPHEFWVIPEGLRHTLGLTRVAKRFRQTESHVTWWAQLEGSRHS